MSLRLLLALALLTLPAAAQQSVIRKSLCRISNTAQEPNYRMPWLSGTMGGGSGTGWVVGKERLMTNAHVVSNARFLTRRKGERSEEVHRARWSTSRTTATWRVLQA